MVITSKNTARQSLRSVSGTMGAITNTVRTPIAKAIWGIMQEHKHYAKTKLSYKSITIIPQIALAIGVLTVLVRGLERSVSPSTAAASIFYGNYHTI